MYNINTAKFMAFVIAMSLMIMPLYTQSTNATTQNDYMEGLMQGEIEAQGNAGWIAGGFCCGVTGILGAYIFEPSPPAHLLMGKSTEYVMGFTEGYKTESKKRNAQYAGIGCIGCGAIYFLFNIMLLGV